MPTQRSTLTALLIVAPLVPSAAASLAQPVTPPAQSASSAPGGAMLLVENTGQWPAARFQVWNSPLGAGTTWLAEDGIWLVVSRQVDKDQVDKEGRSHCDDPLVSLPTCLPVYPSVALKLSFPGSNPAVRIEPFDPLTTTVSYFIGDDPARWRPDVPVWGGVRYVDLYPDVDLVLGGRAGGWQLNAAPGAVVDQVRVQIEGADVVALDRSTLQLDGAAEPLSIILPSAPFAYQVIGLSNQNKSLTLTVHSGHRPSQVTRPADDPTNLLYSTYMGGNSVDVTHAIAVDEAGSAYVTGNTGSGDFPTTPGAFDPSYSNGDAFVVKLNSTGNGLAYATFLGGSRGDSGYAIAVDGTGCAYLTGTTGSSDFPIPSGAFDPSYNGGLTDAFVAKLNPAGSELTYATFLGGSSYDSGAAVAVDRSGSASVTGSTRSSDFLTTPGTFDPSYNGGSYGGDAFVASLNPAGSSLAYATFLGGSSDDYGNAIAVDGAGRAYVTGRTYSSDFPTTPGAFDTSYDRYYDAFVVTLTSTGGALAYATFLGSRGDDEGWGIAVDGVGNAFVAGWTGSRDFPTTPGAFDTSHNGTYDLFVAKLNQAGSGLVYATFVGGLLHEYGYAIAVNDAGNAFLAGGTSSSNFPTTPGAFDSTFGGGTCGTPPYTDDCYDAFVTRLSADGSTLVYSTYLGSSGDGGHDLGLGIALGEVDSAYVTGYTASSDFPTTPGAFDTSYNGGDCSGSPCVDGFVAKLDMRSRWWLPLVLRRQ